MTMVIFPQDLSNALVAIDRVTDNLPLDGADAYTAGYLAGHRGALEAVALMFGVASPEPQTAWRVVDKTNKNKRS